MQFKTKKEIGMKPHALYDYLGWQVNKTQHGPFFNSFNCVHIGIYRLLEYDGIHNRHVPSPVPTVCCWETYGYIFKKKPVPGYKPCDRREVQRTLLM